MICENCGRPILPGQAYAPVFGRKGFGLAETGGAHMGPCPTRRPFLEARVKHGVLPVRRDWRYT